MTEFDELLTSWDSEIEAALRAAEDELPEARRAVLEAEEAAASHNDFTRKVVEAFAGRELMPAALAARLEEMEREHRSAQGTVSLRKQQVVNLEYRIADLYAALVRIDRARSGEPRPGDDAAKPIEISVASRQRRAPIVHDPIVPAA